MGAFVSLAFGRSGFSLLYEDEASFQYGRVSSSLSEFIAFADVIECIDSGEGLPRPNAGVLLQHDLLSGRRGLPSSPCHSPTSTRGALMDHSQSPFHHGLCVGSRPTAAAHGRANINPDILSHRGIKNEAKKKSYIGGDGSTVPGSPRRWRVWVRQPRLALLLAIARS